MKIRNGFVSNSSSSSFILSYNKNRVLTNPEEIVEYIKNNPDSPIVFNGGEHGEGDDIFELDEEWKSLIRKFPQEFIKTNTGTQTYTDYEYHPEDTKNHYHTIEKQIPKVTAYVDGVELYHNPAEYEEFDVDMSDVPFAAVSLEESLDSENADSETKKRIEIANNWYKISAQREKELREAREEELMKQSKETIAKKNNISVDDIESEIVWVSNGACDPDMVYADDFAERYLTSEIRTYNDDPAYYHIKKSSRGASRPFTVFYANAITDKQQIVDYVNKCTSKVYLIWTNPVYNSIEDDPDTMYDFYEIGAEEAKILTEHKDSFIENDREAVLFTFCDVVTDSGDAPYDHGDKMTMNCGKVIVIPAGSDVKDFKKNVVEGDRFE